MTEYLILGILLIAVLWFFNRDRVKNRFYPDKPKNLTIDQQFNSEKREREKKIDRLLSKMGKNGTKDLSAKDRKRLDELSKK